jgi:hypothetical protein
MKAIIKRIESQEEERIRLLAELTLWACVQEQGVDPATVDVFGYDPKYLTKEEYRAYFMASKLGKPDPVTGQRENHVPASPYRFGTANPDGTYSSRVYNYVRRKDGTTVVLHPPVKVPPKG